MIVADLRIAVDAEDLVGRAAAAVAQLLEADIRQQGSASIALSGGVWWLDSEAAALVIPENPS